MLKVVDELLAVSTEGEIKISTKNKECIGVAPIFYEEEVAKKHACNGKYNIIKVEIGQILIKNHGKETVRKNENAERKSRKGNSNL